MYVTMTLPDGLIDEIIITTNGIPHRINPMKKHPRCINVNCESNVLLPLDM